MKLIQEYIIKIVILCIVSVVVIEGFITFLLVIRANIIFDSIYKETMEKTEQKAIEITQKIEEYATNLLTRYMTDLKLIGKHALLLNGNEESTDDDVIDRDSEILKNSNKEIILATLENLTNSDVLKNISKKDNIFDYINQYEEEFKNSTDKNYILNSLFSDSHKELNYVGYYSYVNQNDYTKLTEEENISIKYILSILKTIFIRRYIIKRANMDYISFFIFNSKEIFIYPPQPYNETNLYFFEYSYPTANCNFSVDNKNNTQQFPRCIYDYMNDKLIEKGDNFLLIIKEKIDLQKNYAALCLKIPFLRNQNEAPFICSELEFSSIFNTANFDVPQKFEFGMFTSSNGTIIPLVNSKKDSYQKILDIFNNTEETKYKIGTIKNSQTFTLFHFLYYNLTGTLKNHTELHLNDSKIDIDKEYNEIHSKIGNAIKDYNKSKGNYIKFTFNKTICQKKLLDNDFEFLTDEYEIIIIPLTFTIHKINPHFLETSDTVDRDLELYIYSIISTNPKTNKDKLGNIIRIKIERVVLLFTFLTAIILCFYLLLISLISQSSLKSINDIIAELKRAEINSGGGKNYILEEDKTGAPNKEMLELKMIYEAMRKILIIKQAFEKEYYLDKHNLEFYNLVRDIKKKDIKEICTSFLGFYHFKNGSYSLAENEFRSTLFFIQEKESKIISGKNNEFDDKIKDAIKRSSTESYINEYSIFEKIDENMLAIIKIKILKQRFIYLLAMTKFKLGHETINNPATSSLTPAGGLNPGGINKTKIQKDKDKKKNYFIEAINLFTECKNINILLGINPIKVIYSLIMISKCYMRLGDYKNSINNINEALSLFFELSKSFKDYHSKNYNPKIMLFIENNIFHYILYTLEKICSMNNKTNACNWIILKIFETSPFLISNVHYNSGLFFLNYLNVERNKTKIQKNEQKSPIILKEYEKAKKYFAKIIPRMNIKNMNINKRSYLSEKMLSETNHSTSYKTKSEVKTEKSLFSSTLKKEMQTGRVSTSFHLKNKNINKIITLCLSEKILKKVNGLELKDVIIKYFQKYFAMNENDKFSFIQFANNGKKTVYFKMEQLDYFLLKIQKTKNTFELTDSYKEEGYSPNFSKKQSEKLNIGNNSNLPFMELYNIFDSIIKNYPAGEENITDNIILMFINSDDIRFTSMKECIYIVEELNKKNTSVFLLSYDEEIKKEKINNIHSFLNGLFEGYFFQIKNYQQIKQIFINISTIKYQSNFFGYDFDSLDHTL
jgi:hypothetical protein